MSIKTIDIKPVTGYMDARSNPEDVPLGEYRFVQNIGVTQKSKLCRIPGWDKLLSQTDYNNQDLHDQLLSITGLSARYPINFIYEVTSARKSTMLLAGTEQALYALNNGTGNWKVVWDALGGGGARVKAATLGDVTILSNGKDAIRYWNFDQAVTEAGNQSVATVPDLTSIGVTKAGVVVTFKGTMFLMNVTQLGSVVSNRLVWSNFERPLEYIATADSTAGNFDIDTGETILGAEAISDSLLVYTNKGIWEVLPSGGGTTAFVVAKRYGAAKTGENCLFYPNTLISTGNEHLYFGSDGIYLYNKFLDKPQRVDWMHKASSVIFDTIDQTNCVAQIGSYNSDRKEALFSWAKAGETIPSKTMVFNTEFPFTYVLDHGFSAFVTYVPKQSVQTLQEWILEKCLCTAGEFDSVFGSQSQEGGFCAPQAAVSCPTPPQSFYTQQSLTVGDGVTTEDYTKAEADSDSFCAQLAGITISELCEAEFTADECNAGKRFIAASSVDLCLKEFTQNMYRERCSNYAGCGTYLKEGYQSVLRTGPMSFNIYHDLKELHRLDLEINAPYAITPGHVILKVGVSAQALDPNDDICGIIWTFEDAKRVQCLSTVTPLQHRLQKTIPNEGFEWPLFYIGKFMYAELIFTNPYSSPHDTGVAFCMSRMSFDLNKVEKNYP